MKKLIISALIFHTFLSTAFACTTMIVTKGASADGSVFVTHSNDGYSGDTSVVYVPAADHEPGQMRAVFPSACAGEPFPLYNTGYIPRLNVKDRGPDYQFDGVQESIPLGYIPQVEHTYAYLDSNYGIINEHGLMLGECTDHSKRTGYIGPDKTKGIFYASELGRVALERCTKAREAVNLIGKLIDQYGLWGTAETLLVGDKEEAYVIEMVPNPSGVGGFWVAQKVPDGEFFVAANQFRIRGLDPNNKDQIFNLAMLDEIKRLGWAKYNKEGLLDWLKSIDSSEYSHPYACLRRVWRAMDIVAPSKKFPAWVDNYDTEAYPFSVKPDKKITLDVLKRIHRDTYTSSEFDYRKGETGGLFSQPYGFGLHNKERIISVTSISYIWINQVNDKLPAPISWIALTSPAESVFVPLPVAPITKRYSRVERKKYDEEKFYWASTEVGTLTRGYYSNLIPLVRKTATRLEQESEKKIELSLNMSKDDFNKMLLDNSDDCFNVWKDLPAQMLEFMDSGSNVKYAKGHEPEYIKNENYDDTSALLEERIAKNPLVNQYMSMIEEEKDSGPVNVGTPKAKTENKDDKDSKESKDAKKDSNSQVNQEQNTQSNAGANTNVDGKTDSKAESNSEKQAKSSDVATDIKAGTEKETETSKAAFAEDTSAGNNTNKTEATDNSKSEAKVGSKAETKAEVKTDAKVEVKLEAKAEVKADAKTKLNVGKSEIVKVKSESSEVKTKASEVTKEE